MPRGVARARGPPLQGRQRTVHLGGEELGITAASVLHETLEDFVDDVLLQGPALLFVVFVLSCRVGRRNHTLTELLNHVTTTARRDWGTWVTMALKTAFGLYCISRQAAAPMKRQPVLTASHALRLPRALQRVLTDRGVYGETRHSRVPIHRQACNRLRDLWESMRGVQVVMWVDNYYRRRIGSNPAVGYAPLSASVFSVLHTDPMRMCPSPLTHEELAASRHLLHEAFERAAVIVRDILPTLVAEHVPLEEIRVPLDVERTHVRSPQWSPFQLTKENVSTSDEFVKVLHHLRENVLPHLRPPMPLLCDVNLYYRLMKLVYGRGYAQWDVAHGLRFTPPVFGCWHLYKHCATLVWRAFLPYVVFLNHGTQRDGEQQPCAPRLRSMEFLYAALMLLSPRRRAELRQHALLMRTRADTADPASLPAYRNELEDLSRVAVGMERLANHYAPLLFYMGHLCRQCTWDGRARGSGRDVKKLLSVGVVMLRQLLGDSCTRDDYFRGAGVALMLWREWHDDLYAVAFSEECCEASLSRLAGKLHHNPKSCTPEGAYDEFLLVEPGRRGFKDLRPSRVPQDLRDMVFENLRRYLSTTQPVVTYTPWDNTNMCYAQAAWPRDYLPPPTLPLRAEGRGDVMRLAALVLHNLAKAKEPELDTPLFDALEDAFRNRSADAQQRVELTLQRNFAHPYDAQRRLQ